MKEYRRKHQEFPLQLPPHEQQEELTKAFEELKVACEGPEMKKHHWRNWMSESKWLLIKQCMLLRWTGQLRRSESQRMQRTIHAVLKKDRAVRTAQVGESMVAELVKGNVHEALRHLKGWYRSATEMQARLWFQTMDRQTMERVDLYRRRNPPAGPPLIVNVRLLTGEI